MPLPCCSPIGSCRDTRDGSATLRYAPQQRPEGSLRLLYITPGRAVSDHGHGGLELTLVLQGSFRDAFGVGDVEVAAEDVQHAPIAGEGQ